MRGAHTCRRCSRTGRIAVGNCSACTSPYCGRHGGWDRDGDRWLCSKCARELKITLVKI